MTKKGPLTEMQMASHLGLHLVEHWAPHWERYWELELVQHLENNWALLKDCRLEKRKALHWELP